MKKKPSRAELEKKIRQLEAKAPESKTADDPVDPCGQFYNLCIESAPYGIMAHDDKGRILIFNSQLEKISGYRQEEIPDIKTWIEKLYPDEEYRKLVLEERKKAGSEQRLRKREAIITTKAGDKSLCQFSSLLLKSEIRIVFIKNVAGQRQAEELLHESEERFRLLSEAAVEAIIIHRDGVLLKANDQFFKMFGYRPQELLGTQVIARVIAGESIEVVKKTPGTRHRHPQPNLIGKNLPIQGLPAASELPLNYLLFYINPQFFSIGMIPANIFSGKSAERAAGLLPAAPSGLCAAKQTKIDSFRYRNNSCLLSIRF